MRNISFNKIQSNDPLTNLYLGSALLTISLLIAALMNWYNKKIEIKEK